MSTIVKHQQYTSSLVPYEELQPFIDKFIKSGALPAYVTSPELAYSMINYGREHGFKPLQSLHFLTPVNGTVTINAKGVAAKLSQNNIIVQPAENAYGAYIYVYRDKEIASNRVLGFAEVLGRFDLAEEFNAGDEAKKTKLLKSTTPVDRIVTLKYGHKYQKEQGRWDIDWIGEHSYFWSDVKEAGLDTKDTYIKYPRTMMMHRCKTEICKLLGLITESEMEEVLSALGQEVEISDVNDTIFTEVD